MDTFDHELLGQLLEWSPTVIATAHVAEQLNMMGIKVDRILGNDVGDVMQSDVTHISLHNSSDIEAALNSLIVDNYTAVNIVTDDFAINDYVGYARQINLVILSKQTKTYPISSGFTKWLPAGELITIETQPRNLVVSGLEATGTGQFITLQDAVIRLEFADDFVFITELV